MPADGPYHHGDLRETLLQIAIRLLDEEGIEALGVRRLAREAGVAHSAPANHFRTHRQLLTAIAVQCLQGLVANVSSRLSAASHLDHIRELAKSVLRYGLRHPNRYRLMFRWDLLEEEDGALRQAKDELYSLLSQSLNFWPESDASCSGETRAFAIWSLVHGYLTLRLDGALQAGRDEKTGLPRELAVLEAGLLGILPK